MAISTSHPRPLPENRQVRVMVHENVEFSASNERVVLGESPAGDQQLHHVDEPVANCHNDFLALFWDGGEAAAI